MMPTPAHARLLDFGRPSPPRPLPAFAELGGRAMERAPQSEPTTPPPETAEAAYQRGIAEGRHLAASELEAERHALLARHSGECGKRVEAAAAALAEQLDRQMADLFHAVSASAARALTPLLRQRIHDSAIASIAGRLGAALKERSGLTVRFEGPADILDSLAAHPALRGNAVVLVPAEQVDVRITIGELLLETQIAAWVARIEDHR